MPSRTPIEAYLNFVEPIQRALNVISVGRLLLGQHKTNLAIGSLIDSSFNGGDLAPLVGQDGGRVYLRAGCRARLELGETAHDPFQCSLVAYSYSFVSEDFHEIFAFHWNSNARRPERSYPHLHLGRAVSGSGAFLSGRLHKLHIPTGIVKMEAVVRFAIEELGIRTRPGMDRAAVLAELNRLIGDA